MYIVQAKVTTIQQASIFITFLIENTFCLDYFLNGFELSDIQQMIKKGKKLKCFCANFAIFLANAKKLIVPLLL